MAVSLDSYSDLEDDLDTLTESFNKAAEHVKTLVSSLDPPKLLEIYSYYKQATEGPCTIARPRWYEMQAKAKWDAWNALGKTPQDVAKKHYINLIQTLDPTFDPAHAKTESWVTVSCPANTESSLQDSEKNAFDFVKENNVTGLIQYLNAHPEGINQQDESGLGLLHWAADRGCLEILNYLLNTKLCDVNMLDLEGQTALHYAASCDHLNCAELLIKMGAKLNIKDNDGNLAVDLASDENTIELLKEIL